MNIKILFSLVFVSLTWLAHAQVPKQVRKANEMFRSEKFCEAADECALAYAKLTRKGKRAIDMKSDMAFKTGECYRQTEHMSDAHDWYEKAILLNYQAKVPMVVFYNAEMLRNMGEYKKAIENYNAYKKLVPGDTKADVGIKSCEMTQEFKANKTKHVVSNEEKLNTDGFEMSPMFSDKKESLLMFSTTRAGGAGGGKDPRSCDNYMDLWTSQKDPKGNWSQPEVIKNPEINTEDNEGTVCFDGRSKVMFFTRCPNIKKQNLGCNIFMAELKGKEWGDTVRLNLKNHDSISVGHPCVTEDGKFLIFASDMPGGFGGRDLWYTTFEKKSGWAAPKNMGAEINTAGNELFPTLGKNGELFYSTDGMPGMGGLDIVKAAKVAGEENKWENPVNMGSPINSESNDYGLVEFNERRGYFTSERKGSAGKDLRPDIWSYELPPNLFDLKVIVAERGDKTKRIDLVTVNVVGSDGTSWSGETGKNGEIYWEKYPNGDRYIKENTSYKVSIGKAGYYENPKIEEFTTVGLNYDQNFIVEMNLLPRKPIRLPEVRYPLGKWTLLVDSTINSKDSLNFVYDLLTEYPGMVLELSSHTDSRGSDKANQLLSDNRAKECVKYLVTEKGIDPKRLVPVGKGEREPTTWKDENGQSVKLTEAYINQFKTTNPKKFELLHQLNRRTEGKVLRMDYNPAAAAAPVQTAPAATGTGAGSGSATTTGTPAKPETKTPAATPATGTATPKPTPAGTAKPTPAGTAKPTPAGTATPKPKPTPTPKPKPAGQQ